MVRYEMALLLAARLRGGFEFEGRVCDFVAFFEERFDSGFDGIDFADSFVGYDDVRFEGSVVLV